MPLLPCVEIEPDQPPAATVICLHGLGASGHDFAPIVPALHLPAGLGVRFVCPHAPALALTISRGFRVPAWYDIRALNLERDVDEAGLRASSAAVSALIDRERERGIASTGIVLAGFSQGGAVAYHTALGYPAPLAGLLTLSSYFPTHHRFTAHPANRQIPVLILHGDRDGVVPEALARHACRALTEKGYQPRYRTYPMGHTVCPEEIADIGRWLAERLSASGPG